MARRIEIELTSTRPDGTWTWRAAGAKEPKGLLDGGLLHEGAKPGDVLRAEAEFEIEGITIISVVAPKADGRPEAERIEVIGPARTETPGVTTQLVGRSDRRRDGDRRPRRDGDGDRRPRREGDGDRRPRRPSDAAGPDGMRSRPDRSRNQADRSASRPERSRNEAGGERAAGDGSGRGDRPPRRDRPAGGDGPRTPARRGRDGESRRQGAPDGAGRGEPRGAGRSTRPGPGRPAGGDGGGSDRRAKRLNPGHAHRQAMLESLSPEQRPIAEQVLRGGIPAVRTALHLEREKAAAEGRPAPNTDQLVAMAEELLPRLKAAEWRDRAEAAAKEPDEISLRDLKSIVAGADVARDDETRALAAALREALERRAEATRTQWAAEISQHLDENKVVRALRLSARPPEPLVQLEPELSQRLSDAAGSALSPETSPDRWLALLDATAASPVRRSVRPAGLPANPGPDLKQAAYQQSGRIPALAAMLGVTIPPPPVPVSRRRRPPAQANTPPAQAARPDQAQANTPPAQPARADQAEPDAAPTLATEPTQATEAAEPTETQAPEAIETEPSRAIEATGSTAQTDAEPTDNVDAAADDGSGSDGGSGSVDETGGEEGGETAVS